MPYTGEEYEGNSTLCCKNRFATEDDYACNFDNIEYSSPFPKGENTCKKCLKIYNKNIKDGNE